MRNGTLGSIAGGGDPPGPTIQALLIARPRLARALWTSWSKMVVALVSESQLIAVVPLAGKFLHPACRHASGKHNYRPCSPLSFLALRNWRQVSLAVRLDAWRATHATLPNQGPALTALVSLGE